MSIGYIKKNNLLHHSDRLGREVFVDELGDLTDSELAQLIIEADHLIADLREDHRDLAEGDTARFHIRHKLTIVRTYRQAARIEAGIRETERNDKLRLLRDNLATRLGAGETAAMFKAVGL